MSKLKREGDGVLHSPPGSVDQQSEDSFPASDSPSSSPGAVGAPEKRPATPMPDRHQVKGAESKVKSGEAKNPHKY